MPTPFASVIIPTYDGRDLIRDAIRSVLQQTYANLELLVVDDCSPGGYDDIVEEFGDPRLRLLRHQQNHGAQAARKTGVDSSRGEIIFFLDQDDYFHPCKVERHVRMLETHPEIGFSYNPHFIVLHPMGWTVGIWRPPLHVTLADVVLGFPMSPSVWVMRRRWAVRDELYDESAMLRGAEVVICGRLLVAGCRFGMVDQALNYRRNHVGRRFTNPVSKCREERLCQDRMIGDARVGHDGTGLRAPACLENYLVWANVAYSQGDTESGRALLEEALQIDGGIACGTPSLLAAFVLSHALTDARDAEAQVIEVFEQIAGRLPTILAEREWAVGQSHLLRAAQHLLWARPGEAAGHLDRLRSLGWRADAYAYGRLSYELLCFELEYGRRAGSQALRTLVAALAGLEGFDGRALAASYLPARAFFAHANELYSEVPQHVLRAFFESPSCARNRGAWSILAKSLLGRHAHRGAR